MRFSFRVGNKKKRRWLESSGVGALLTLERNVVAGVAVTVLLRELNCALFTFSPNPSLKREDGELHIPGVVGPKAVGVLPVLLVVPVTALQAVLMKYALAVLGVALPDRKRYATKLLPKDRWRFALVISGFVR
jgi:hypothetical protein